MCAIKPVIALRSSQHSSIVRRKSLHFGLAHFKLTKDIYSLLDKISLVREISIEVSSFKEVHDSTDAAQLFRNYLLPYSQRFGSEFSTTK